MNSDLSPRIADAFSVAGRVVVVTGAAGWIGSIIAETFTQNGAHVALSDRPTEALTAYAAKLESARAFPADLAGIDSIKGLIAEVAAHFGRIDAIIHCGGVPASGPALEGADTDFDKLFHTNLRSAWLLARDAFPHLEKSHGCIVNIASVNGHRPMFAGTLYAATKAGLLNLTQELAVEFGPRDVRVNSVSPGPIIQPNRNFDAMRAKLTPEAFAAYEKMVFANADEIGKYMQPLPRGGKPVDVAMACLYLCSPAARYVNGADILVDGGFLMDFTRGPQRDTFWKKMRSFLRDLPRESWREPPPEWVQRD